MGGRLRPSPPPDDRPRFRWGPENPTVVDVLVGKLARHGKVEFDDPHRDDNFYRIVHVDEGCPNVAVQWASWDRPGAYTQPCVECDGYPCENCTDAEGAARWALARALIGAALAGRAIHELNSTHVVSSDGDEHREVANDGERPAGEEARVGRPEEPEASSGGEGPAPLPRWGVLAVEQRSPGTVEWVSDHRGTWFRLNSGGHVREVSWENAWDALWGISTVSP